MPLMRRRPLLRAAAIGGGAYYAGKKRWESQQQQGAPPPGGPAGASASSAGAGRPAGGIAPDTMTQLEQLGKLHTTACSPTRSSRRRRRSCWADQAARGAGSALAPRSGGSSISAPIKKHRAPSAVPALAASRLSASPVDGST